VPFLSGPRDRQSRLQPEHPGLESSRPFNAQQNMDIGIAVSMHISIPFRLRAVILRSSFYIVKNYVY
jgi:hypothetical protein